MHISSKEIFEKMNEWFAQCKPFFFLLDYKAEKGEFLLLEDAAANNIFFHTVKASNPLQESISYKKLQFEKFPETLESYREKFDKAKHEINIGNSYLLNLTCQSHIETNYNLLELFQSGKAKYKLYYKNQFVHFSPETFVNIKDNVISTFPMKGTIDASLLDSDKKLLEDQKEITEQYIITDLLRNDLSIVAENVWVKNFRYLDRIETNNKPLYQVSTHIEGSLKKEFSDKPGTIFAKILPAGSITGAPKKKTIEILEEIEGYDRGFYTGVWGIFDGKEIDSCVIIRMIEQQEKNLVFKSGGGITASSILEKEYQEMIDKIYVPIY